MGGGGAAGARAGRGGAGGGDAGRARAGAGERDGRRLLPSGRAVRRGDQQCPDRARPGRRGADPAGEFARTWRDTAARFEAEGEGRVVRTRHGDPMLLTEFMVTRVVELAVHGLDLADALGRPAWLTEEASDVLEALLLKGADGPSVRSALGWDRATFLRKATGRAELDAAEQAEVERAGITWLTLG
ncbi:hypothetical protein KCH_01710 [Kitasatospora cheerisanensis KCTC 2395]|uniref:Mycothiol-dependent maleylpyruvate isomerase metal-binding domain-containing protein n=1 Tax=Kitasatospora cheerisanensis KCTC 2395 TaxID=1348663 RepID=A0A066Z779_9ACTN|nr:hypothetical protein KCH_01710 [Kitasatospora cheerisanensis KCTC 2395]